MVAVRGGILGTLVAAIGIFAVVLPIALIMLAGRRLAARFQPRAEDGNAMA